MGLFNFTKQNKTSDSEQSVQESKPSIVPVVTNVEVPHIPEPKVEKVKMPEFPANRARKDEIDDFFSININNIFKYKPESEGKQEYEAGQWAEVFTLALRQQELDCFHKIHIIQYEDESYDLVFKSDLCEINKALQEFISFCIKKFGADFMGKKELTDRDVSDLSLGAFSRLWMNRVRIDNIYLSVCITLYNIKPEKK